LSLGLEHVDRRLPARGGARAWRGFEELAVERFRLLEHGAGFGPHLVFWVTHHKHLGQLALNPSPKLIRRNMTRLKKSTAI
jgi:hypothetical protein